MYRNTFTKFLTHSRINLKLQAIKRTRADQKRKITTCGASQPEVRTVVLTENKKTISKSEEKLCKHFSEDKLCKHFSEDKLCKHFSEEKLCKHFS